MASSYQASLASFFELAHCLDNRITNCHNGILCHYEQIEGTVTFTVKYESIEVYHGDAQGPLYAEREND